MMTLRDLLRERADELAARTSVEPQLIRTVADALASDDPAAVVREAAEAYGRASFERGLTSSALVRGFEGVRVAALALAGEQGVQTSIEDERRLAAVIGELAAAALVGLDRKRAHDMRNPLGAASMACQLLQGATEPARLLQMLDRNLKKLQQLIERSD
jgi:signal transduction histidine kinase